MARILIAPAFFAFLPILHSGPRALARKFVPVSAMPPRPGAVGYDPAARFEELLRSDPGRRSFGSRELDHTQGLEIGAALGSPSSFAVPPAMSNASDAQPSNQAAGCPTAGTRADITADFARSGALFGITRAAHGRQKTRPGHSVADLQCNRVCQGCLKILRHPSCPSRASHLQTSVFRVPGSVRQDNGKAASVHHHNLELRTWAAQ